MCTAVARTSLLTAAELEANVPKPLSDLERRVLAYIVDYLRSNTYQPSVREIGREFTIKSTKTVSELLQSLANKGWIERDPSRSRGVRVLGMERAPGTISLPLLADSEAAGPSSYLEFDRRLAGAETSFLMALGEDPPQAEGLRSGDLLLMERLVPADVRDGDLLAVRTGNLVHVRRCVGVNDDTVAFAPIKESDPPLEVAREKLNGTLQGRVCGMVRRMRPVVPHASALTEAPVAG
jgi:repressor LexA